MKKKYETPQVEKIEFDYSETVVASVGGFSWQVHTNAVTGCTETPTELWVINDSDSSCYVTRPGTGIPYSF